MKKILFTGLFAGYSIFGNAQTGNHQYDSILTRTIMRSIIRDGCIGCPDTGVALLKIIKTDSIMMKTIYASDTKYDYANDANLILRLNDQCRTYIQEEYTVIVPLYFYFEDKMPSAEMIKSVEKKIEEIRGTTHVIKPIIIVTYGPQRRMKPGQ